MFPGSQVIKTAKPLTKILRGERKKKKRKKRRGEKKKQQCHF